MITDSEWQALGSDNPKFSADAVLESLVVAEVVVALGATAGCVVVVVVVVAGAAVAAVEVVVVEVAAVLAGEATGVEVTVGGVATVVVELVLVPEDGVVVDVVDVVDVVLAAGAVVVGVAGEVGLLTGAAAAIEGGVITPQLQINASNPFATNLRAIHNSFSHLAHTSYVPRD
jgi:hypothetical protein